MKKREAAAPPGESAALLACGFLHYAYAWAVASGSAFGCCTTGVCCSTESLLDAAGTSSDAHPVATMDDAVASPADTIAAAVAAVVATAWSLRRALSVIYSAASVGPVDAAGKATGWVLRLVLMVLEAAASVGPVEAAVAAAT